MTDETPLHRADAEIIHAARTGEGLTRLTLKRGRNWHMKLPRWVRMMIVGIWCDGNVDKLTPRMSAWALGEPESE